MVPPPRNASQKYLDSLRRMTSSGNPRALRKKGHAACCVASCPRNTTAYVPGVGAGIGAGAFFGVLKYPVTVFFPIPFTTISNSAGVFPE